MKNQIYLAEDYGASGWRLTPVDTAQEALERIMRGETYGECKILMEVDVVIGEPR